VGSQSYHKLGLAGTVAAAALAVVESVAAGRLVVEAAEYTLERVAGNAAAPQSSDPPRSTAVPALHGLAQKSRR
jgi:hypothetical protein